MVFVWVWKRWTERFPIWFVLNRRRKKRLQVPISRTLSTFKALPMMLTQIMTSFSILSPRIPSILCPMRTPLPTLKGWLLPPSQPKRRYFPFPMAMRIPSWGSPCHSRRSPPSTLKLQTWRQEMLMPPIWIIPSTSPQGYAATIWHSLLTMDNLF